MGTFGLKMEWFGPLGSFSAQPIATKAPSKSIDALKGFFFFFWFGLFSHHGLDLVPPTHRGTKQDGWLYVMVSIQSTSAAEM